jgi:predicted nucleotidyltransferase
MHSDKRVGTKIPDTSVREILPESGGVVEAPVSAGAPPWATHQWRPGSTYGAIVFVAVFTPEERDRLRDVLIAVADTDERIVAAAITGSAALDREDRWSDIDLAVGVAAEADLSAVIADWTERMYQEHQVVHHVDVTRGGTVYRVFLLATTLQVDLAFSPAAEFGAIAPSFRLLFGTAAEQPAASVPSDVQLIGLGWLYALHAHSSIARGRVWQAEYMISGVRDHALALACLRHGVPAYHGRGIDGLPPDVIAPITKALVRSLDIAELRRTFRAACEALIFEIGQVDSGLANRLAEPLGELAGFRQADWM